MLLLGLALVVKKCLVEILLFGIDVEEVFS